MMMRTRWRWWAVGPAVLVLAGVTAACEVPVLPELVVTSTDQTGDADPGDGVCETALGNGVCTFPAALDEANAIATGADITVPGGDYTGVDLHITDHLAINTDCRLELQIPTTTIDNTFDFKPKAGDPSRVDVNLVGTPTVNTGTINYEFISGICDGDTFLIGDIVNSLAGGKIQGLVGDGFRSQLTAFSNEAARCEP